MKLSCQGVMSKHKKMSDWQRSVGALNLVPQHIIGSFTISLYFVYAKQSAISFPTLTVDFITIQRS